MANPEAVTGEKPLSNALFPYPILCEGRGCDRHALYKVASRWSDDFTWEWKTYGLVCAECVKAMHASALRRHQGCLTAPGETLDTPVVLELAPGQSSSRLIRRADLETSSDNGGMNRNNDHEAGN